MTTRFVALLTAILMAGLGCSKSDSPSASAPRTAESEPAKIGESKGLSVSADTKPEFVVKAFLDALRRGDKDETSLLLTDKARNETHSKGLVVSPESVPHASFKVAEAEILPQNAGAHVSSVWTEKFDDGTEEEYEIVWVLRKQADGWRIAGMATELAPGQPALYLNFEDPEDMLKKKEEAARQAGLAQPGSEIGAETASGPSTGNVKTATPELPSNKLRR